MRLDKVFRGEEVKRNAIGSEVEIEIEISLRKGCVVQLKQPKINPIIVA
jgi:hypothetical protein